jgi:glycosyltransferase involved in cell wall biosynthesis
LKTKRGLYIYMGKKEQLSGVELYRISFPCHHINQYSPDWSMDWTSLSDIEVRGWELVAYLERYDLFVFPRFFFPTGSPFKKEFAKIISLIRKMGKRIAYETDDDYTNEHRFIMDGDAVEIMRWSDALIVTQQYLGQKLAARSGRPYHICPNSLVPSAWKNPELAPLPKQDDKLAILLSGSPTHERDWAVTAEPLRRLMETHGDKAELWVAGYCPDYLKDLPNTQILAGRAYPEYVRLVRSADIVLAPVLPDDKFNMGKSPIKAVEGMGALRDLGGAEAGAAVIATDNPIYRLAIKNGKSGIVVKHNAVEWYQALERVVLNDEVRRSLQVNGYRAAWQNFDASKTWLEWTRAFDTILRKPAHQVVLPTQGEG